MRIRLLLFLTIFMHQAFAQTWTTLNIPSSGRYDDLFFLNDSTGWACNDQGNSYKTVNGGETWTLHAVDNNNYLRCIEFMDADTGFCGGFNSNSYLYKSTDGGASWTNISATIPGLTGGICGLSCPEGKVVYGCGIWTSPAYLIKSLDGGVSWQTIDMSAYASALVDILFINQDIGWVSGRAPNNGGGIILLTTDGGATWQPVHNTNIHGDYVWKLQRLDDDHWFASIERDMVSGAKTNILKSTDGISWETILVKNSYFRLQTVGFVTPEHGWTGDNALFETTNGGQTWQSINASSIFGGAFNRFFRINAQKAFLSGNSIFRYDGISSASQEPAAQNNNQDIHQLKVSPNPSSGDIQISIDLRQKTQVILKIYAFNGGFEEVLWTGEHASGEYLLQASLANKPAGVYVIYLKTHHGAQYTLVTLAPK